MKRKSRKTNKELEKTIYEIEELEWKHRNLILLAISIAIAYYILKSGYLQPFVSGLGNLGYVGSFFTGLFFAYGLTTAPAAVTLFILSENLNPFLIAFTAAFGAVLSDYLIFKFVRDSLVDEIKLLSKEIDNLTKPIEDLLPYQQKRILIWKKVSRSKIWKNLIPVIAGFILASPLPDELGVAIFGAVKYDVKKFIVLSYCLHFIGILAITYLVKIL